MDNGNKRKILNIIFGDIKLIAFREVLCILMAPGILHKIKMNADMSNAGSLPKTTGIV